ncbi:DUF7501 family protein [Halococcus sediminicola]
MTHSSQSAPSPQWSGPERCPFCGDQLDNGGEAFVRHVDVSEACRRGFDRWRHERRMDQLAHAFGGQGS